MSLRARLTLLSAAVVVLALLAFTALTVTRTRQVLDQRAHEELTALASGLMGVARQQVSRVEDGRRPLSYERLAGSEVPGAFVGYAVVVRRDGSTVPLPRLAAPAPSAPPVPADVFRRPRGEPFEVVAADRSTYDAMVVSVEGSDAVMFVALADQAFVEATSQLVDMHLVTGGILVVIFLFLAGGAVHLGLRPLRAITRSAARVADGSTGERVPTAAAGTEIGALTATLNDMLATIERTVAGREEALRRTERFAADAAHELRTPVTAILGYAQLYQQGAVASGDRLDDVFGRIAQEAARLRDLVDGLLVLNRLDQQSGATVAQPFDVVEVCATAAADSMTIDPTRVVVLEGEATATVVADRNSVFQVVANLLGNVRAHTPSGTTATITVSTDAGTGLVQIDVTDDGPGIPAEHRSGVFDRFYRADAARARRSSGPGSGLGLSIVAALVDQAGGDVTLVAEAPGPGTHMRVRLPGVAQRGADSQRRATPA